MAESAERARTEATARTQSPAAAEAVNAAAEHPGEMYLAGAFADDQDIFHDAADLVDQGRGGVPEGVVDCKPGQAWLRDRPAQTMRIPGNAFTLLN